MTNEPNFQVREAPLLLSNKRIMELIEKPQESNNLNADSGKLVINVIPDLDTDSSLISYQIECSDLNQLLSFILLRMSDTFIISKNSPINNKNYIN